jgi:hypothetical protein
VVTQITRGNLAHARIVASELHYVPDSRVCGACSSRSPSRAPVLHARQNWACCHMRGSPTRTGSRPNAPTTATQLLARVQAAGD